MCRPRVGEANPLFSVCRALGHPTATASRKKPSDGRGISNYQKINCGFENWIIKNFFLKIYRSQTDYTNSSNCSPSRETIPPTWLLFHCRKGLLHTFAKVNMLSPVYGHVRFCQGEYKSLETHKKTAHSIYLLTSQNTTIVVLQYLNVCVTN